MTYAARASARANQIAARMAMPRPRGFVSVLSVGLVFATAGVAAGATATTSRESVSSNGDQANSFSEDAVISADGRYVTFVSDSSNLVAADTNRRIDVFVRDR